MANEGLIIKKSHREFILLHSNKAIKIAPNRFTYSKRSSQITNNNQIMTIFEF